MDGTDSSYKERKLLQSRVVRTDTRSFDGKFYCDLLNYFILEVPIHMSMCVSKSGSVCVYSHTEYIHTDTQTYMHVYIYAHIYIKQE